MSFVWLKEKRTETKNKGKQFRWCRSEANYYTECICSGPHDHSDGLLVYIYFARQVKFDASFQKFQRYLCETFQVKNWPEIHLITFPVRISLFCESITADKHLPLRLLINTKLNCSNKLTYLKSCFRWKYAKWRGLINVIKLNIRVFSFIYFFFFWKSINEN